MHGIEDDSSEICIALSLVPGSGHNARLASWHKVTDVKLVGILTNCAWVDKDPIALPTTVMEIIKES